MVGLVHLQLVGVVVLTAARFTVVSDTTVAPLASSILKVMLTAFELVRMKLTM